MKNSIYYQLCLSVGFSITDCHNGMLRIVYHIVMMKKRFKLRYFSQLFIFFLLLQVANSVIMNHVTIADGCSIQGSVICSNVQLQERVVLKDCQVISLSLSLMRACGWFIIIRLHFALQSRLEQVLWLLLGASAKGRLWLRKRNDTRGSPCVGRNLVISFWNCALLQAGADFVVTASSEYKAMPLTRKKGIAKLHECIITSQLLFLFFIFYFF